MISIILLALGGPLKLRPDSSPGRATPRQPSRFHNVHKVNYLGNLGIRQFPAGWHDSLPAKNGEIA